jgi:hypothetical protein
MIKINGAQIKTPKEQSIEHYNITTSNRTASGLMTMEFIAKKTKLILKWPIIKGSELSYIKSLVDTTTMFFDVTYFDEDGIEHTMTAYMGDFNYDKERFSAQHANAGWYWKSVELHLIER